MLSLLGLISAATVQAAAPAPAAIPTEKLICKRIEEASTGSRLGKTKRICRTQAEWRAMDDETARAINKTKANGLTDPNSMAQGR